MIQPSPTPIEEQIPLMSFDQLYGMYEGHILPYVSTEEEKEEVKDIVWGIQGQIKLLRIENMIEEENNTIPREQKAIKVFANKRMVKIFDKRTTLEIYQEEKARRKRIMKHRLLELFSTAQTKKFGSY